MKITQVHYSKMEELLEPLRPRLAPYKLQIDNDERAHDKKRRFCFDVFHSLKVWNHYSYAEFKYNDEHIYTAMKKLLKEYL
jgi:hypothetical protein